MKSPFLLNWSFAAPSVLGRIGVGAWRRLGLVMLSLMAAVSLGKGVGNALRPDRSDDFQWHPARAVLEGRNPYREFLADPSRPRVISSTENNGFPNYPVTGYVFLAPFGALDWGQAKALWALTNVMCAIGIVWAVALLAGPAGSPARHAALAAGWLMLCSAPARDQISAGQHTLFSVACLLVAWHCGRDPRWRWLSPILIAASWLKFSVTVPLTLAFLIHRRWREPAAALAIQVALLAIVCWWTGAGPVTLVRGYFEATRLALFEMGFRSDVWDTLSVGRALAPWIPGAGLWLSLFALGTVVWTAARRYRLDGDALTTFAILSLPACLVGFHLRYDFVVFALPLAWALSRPVDAAVRAGVAGVAAANWIGARLLENRYYEAIDFIRGVWAPVGVVGMGLIAAATWVVCAWLVARLAVTVKGRPSEAHHRVPLPRRAAESNPIGVA
jgi:hypothetical protein